VVPGRRSFRRPITAIPVPRIPGGTGVKRRFVLFFRSQPAAPRSPPYRGPPSCSISLLCSLPPPFSRHCRSLPRRNHCKFVSRASSGTSVFIIALSYRLASCFPPVYGPAGWLFNGLRNSASKAAFLKFLAREQRDASTNVIINVSMIERGK